MPKYRARVNCFNLPTPEPTVAAAAGQSSRLNGETFVNIVQHLSSSGPDLGIEMIAANFGIGGAGLDFWDSSRAAAPRSWACFRFHSASLGKFDCLVFSLTGSVSTAYGSPLCTTDGFNNPNSGPNTERHVLISFAMHPSGSNVTQTDGPWNGTYSLTSASIGNPVWKVNSAGKGAFFPRQNGIGGTLAPNGTPPGTTTSGSRGCMLSVVPTNTSYTFGAGRKLHIIASEDSLAVMHDTNNSGDCTTFYFGPYTPRSGTTADAPYLCWNSAEGSAPFVTSEYGSTVSTSPLTAQGAICHPNLTSGSRSFVLGGFTGWLSTAFGYNRFLNGGTYEKFPFLALISEGPLDYAVLGTARHVYNGTGMANYSVSSLSASCAWGNGTISTQKLITPWSGSAPTFTPTILQAGENWSLDL